MRRIRVIPALLVEKGRLVKTLKFGARTYVGDPVNTVKILNDKQVDELLMLDIGATRYGSKPDMKMITEIASECFMPLAYGGGITELDQAKRIFAVGVEKVVVNAALFHHPKLIGEIATIYGAQAVVVSIDAKKGMFGGYSTVTHGGAKKTPMNPVQAAKRAVELGAGEIMISNVDHDAVMKGYDIDLIRAVADAVPVPVIAAGGAGSTADFVAAVTEGHASAVAAGALFVFRGPHRAVLVNYPNRAVLKAEVFGKV